VATVDQLAFVDPGAELGDDVHVGPFCFVEKGAIIGDRCRLESHVTIKGGTVMGVDNVVAQGAVLGGDPQDRKYKGEPTFLRIGDRNVIREYVTLHRATGEGKETYIGNDCYFMAFVHFGHNCVVHDWVTVANNLACAGHVTIEDHANIGGMVAIHQFARVGRVAMIGGYSAITRDVPPFMISSGIDEKVHDINAVGLRRQGVSQDARLALHKACKLLFKSQLGLTNAIETVRREVPMTPEIEYLLKFEERRFGGKNGRGDQP
jgi:UDP-N-acetylglucosamine acyltransferase